MKQNKTMLWIAVLIVLFAAISRVVFYKNEIYFSSVIAMALFSGAVIKDRKLAFLMPLVSMFIADVLFQVTKIAPGIWGWGLLVNYVALAVITVVGFNIKKITVLNVAGFSIASSVIFYFLSNTSFFFLENNTYHLYEKSFSGYMMCLYKALPFLRNGMFADLVYSAVFFGGYVLLERYTVKKVVA